MSAKRLFPTLVLIGAVMALVTTGTVLAAGHGSGGGGGGGFHSGGGGGGGGRSFSTFSGGHMNQSFNGGGFQSRAMSPGFATPHAWQSNYAPMNGIGRGNFSMNGRPSAFNEGAWRHTQSWNNWGHGDAWRHGHDFDHDHFVGFPFWSPWWYGGYGLNWPYYYGYDYGAPYYGYDYGSSDYGVPYYGAYSAGYSPQTGGVSDVAPSDPATEEQGVAAGDEEYAPQAREAFRNGDYRGALRLASHAAVDAPRDPAVHELISLALFALKDYRGAAIEAHAALSIGPPIDWPTLYSYYDNVDTYTSQLRALEAFVRANPKAAEGHFLLACHYIMTGSKDAAKTELSEVITLAPKDKLAEQILKQL
jgi:hypothetical protein